MEKTAQAKLGKKKITGDQWQKITIIGLILVVCIAFSFLSEAFLTVENLMNILLQMSVVCIMSFGMTIIIINGGVDLSMGVIIAFTGVVAALFVKGGKDGDSTGNIYIGLLLGILAVWGAAILCQLTGLYVPNAELGMASVLPDFSAGLAVPSLAPTFMQMDFTGLFTLNFLTVVLSFLFVDVFDTLGGIIGMASQGHMLDENGRLPRIRGALLSDAVGTSVGAVLGTSTTTTFAESAAGIAAGGRTGLTSVVTALMFLLSLFLSPLFLAVPGFATAPALVIVGLSMLGSLRALDPADWRESLPAYLTMVAMPFCYSISEGIAVGTISYVAVHLFTGAESRKKVSPVLAILALVFLLKYIFL